MPPPTKTKSPPKKWFQKIIFSQFQFRLKTISLVDSRRSACAMGKWAPPLANAIFTETFDSSLLPVRLICQLVARHIYTSYHSLLSQNLVANLQLSWNGCFLASKFKSSKGRLQTNLIKLGIFRKGGGVSMVLVNFPTNLVGFLIFLLYWFNLHKSQDFDLFLIVPTDHPPSFITTSVLVHHINPFQSP